MGGTIFIIIVTLALGYNIGKCQKEFTIINHDKKEAEKLSRELREKDKERMERERKAGERR